MADYTESQYGQELLWKTPFDTSGKAKWGDTPKVYKASDRMEGLPSFLNDIRRNLGNLGGTVSNWFTGRPNVAGGGLGDATVGRDPNQLLGPAQKVIDPETQALLDELNARNAALQGQLDNAQKGDAYDAIISSLQSRSATDDARLKAMYQAAADYVTGMQPGVEDIYAKAKAGYEGANTAAGNVINTGYENSRNAMANMFKALGIEDAATNILARGEDMSAGQNAATGRLADYLNANLSRNTAGQTAALENLTAMAQAIAGEGARSRAANARAIEDQISQAKVSQQSANMQAQQAAASLAAKYANQPSAQAIQNNWDAFYAEAKKTMNDSDAAKAADTKIRVLFGG